MKIKILLCLLCITIADKTFSQWVQTTNPYAPGPIDHLAINGSNFFAGATCSQTHGSLFLSTNFGASWSHIDGTIPHFCYVYSLYSNSSALLAGLGDSTGALGLYRSTDNGTSWTHINIGSLSNVFITSLFANGSYIFAGLATKGVYKSSDNGLTWTNSSTGLTGGGQYYSFAVNGSNLFLGTNVGVFKSTDNGTTWTAVNTGLPSGGLFWKLTAIGGNVLAGTYGNDLYLTSNNGASWTLVSSLGIAMDFAVVGTKLFGALGGKIYLSLNNGVNWIDVTTSSISSEFINSLAIGNNYLFAGAYTVWKRPLTELTAIDDVNPAVSLSLFPNPFTSECTLRFGKQQHNATISIMDVSGKVVRTIHFSGEEVIIKKSEMKAGVYFLYIIDEDNHSSVHQIVID